MQVTLFYCTPCLTNIAWIKSLSSVGQALNHTEAFCSLHKKVGLPLTSAILRKKASSFLFIQRKKKVALMCAIKKPYLRGKGCAAALRAACPWTDGAHCPARCERCVGGSVGRPLWCVVIRESSYDCVLMVHIVQNNVCSVWVALRAGGQASAVCSCRGDSSSDCFTSRKREQNGDGGFAWGFLCYASQAP